MKEKGFVGIFLLIIGALAAVLLYIAFTKEAAQETITPPNVPTNEFSPSPTSQNTPTSQRTTPSPTSQSTQPTVIQYTISPTRSYSNSSYPTSAPLSTATPVPTGKGKNGGGGGGGSGIVTGG